MRSFFLQLADDVEGLLEPGETCLIGYSGETSDFVRFNQGKVRQAGQVFQNRARLTLIRDNRHASGESTLAGQLRADGPLLETLVHELRATLEEIPEDPHLHYALDAHNTETRGPNRLPSPDDPVREILSASRNLDLVGHYAAGGIFRGFANSLGQRNWFESYNFNFDWSFCLEADRAVKCRHAGLVWDHQAFADKMDKAEAHLRVLSKPGKRITPGRYRVYLAPPAVASIMTMLTWGGFSLKSKCTAQTPLIKMINKEISLHPSIALSENTREGVAAGFDAFGFIKPPEVRLIDKGNLAGFLVSARSAKEYGVPTNGANASEVPVSLDMGPGDLEQDAILDALDTGVYVSDLWYVNYSDRRSCRLTGLTRFATFWVENGRLVAPLEVMRFDESVYRILGTCLVALTKERELLLDPDTYGQRATNSMRLPGALVDEFTFTL